MERREFGIYYRHTAILAFAQQFPGLEDHPTWHEPEDRPLQSVYFVPGNMG